MADRKLDEVSVVTALAVAGSDRAASRRLGVHHSTLQAFLRGHPELRDAAERLRRKNARETRKLARRREREQAAKQRALDPAANAQDRPELANPITPTASPDEHADRVRASIADSRPGYASRPGSSRGHRKPQVAGRTRVRVLPMDGGASARYRDILDGHDHARELRRMWRPGEETVVVPLDVARKLQAQGWQAILLI